jgi:hypothetical protein
MESHQPFDRSLRVELLGFPSSDHSGGRVNTSASADGLRLAARLTLGDTVVERARAAPFVPDRTLPLVELAMAVVASRRTSASKIGFFDRIVEESSGPLAARKLQTIRDIWRKRFQESEGAR